MAKFKSTPIISPINGVGKTVNVENKTPGINTIDDYANLKSKGILFKNKSNELQKRLEETRDLNFDFSKIK